MKRRLIHLTVPALALLVALLVSSTVGAAAKEGPTVKSVRLRASSASRMRCSSRSRSRIRPTTPFASSAGSLRPTASRNRCSPSHATASRSRTSAPTTSVLPPRAATTCSLKSGESLTRVVDLERVLRPLADRAATSSPTTPPRTGSSTASLDHAIAARLREGRPYGPRAVLPRASPRRRLRRLPGGRASPPARPTQQSAAHCRPHRRHGLRERRVDLSRQVARGALHQVVRPGHERSPESRHLAISAPSPRRSAAPASSSTAAASRTSTRTSIPNKPYTIYLGRVFWTAPATGTDSQAGTLIHEISHFDVVAGNG